VHVRSIAERTTGVESRGGLSLDSGRQFSTSQPISGGVGVGFTEFVPLPFVHFEAPVFRAGTSQTLNPEL